MTIQALNYLCGNNLKAVSEVEDLGIHITSNLLPYHLLKVGTPLISTLLMAPSVSIVMEFDCTPCLVPRRLKHGNGKRDSMSHQGVLCNGPWEHLAWMQRMLGRMNNKNFLFAFPIIPSIEPKSQSLLNQSEHACVRGSCIPTL